MALSTPHRRLPARPMPIVALLIASSLMVGAGACSPMPSPDTPVGDGASGNPSATSAALEPMRYIVRFVDQNAKPVPGVTLQVCDDALCQLFVSDEAGACIFELEPRAWEVHVLSAPAGYAVDSGGVPIVLPGTGGELVIELAELQEGTA